MRKRAIDMNIIEPLFILDSYSLKETGTKCFKETHRLSPLVARIHKLSLNFLNGYAINYL